MSSTTLPPYSVIVDENPPPYSRDQENERDDTAVEGHSQPHVEIDHQAYDPGPSLLNREVRHGTVLQ